MFEPGMHVLAVGFSGTPTSRLIREGAARSAAIIPVRGKVYTVDTVNVWPDGTTLTLKEIDNSHLMAMLRTKFEPGFDYRAFRPLSSSSLQVFLKIEEPIKPPEPVA